MKLEWARWLIACLRTPRMFVALTIVQREHNEVSRPNPNPERWFGTQARDFFFHRMRALLREETRARVGLDEMYPCMFLSPLLGGLLSRLGHGRGRRLFRSELLAVMRADDAAAGETAVGETAHEPEEAEAMTVDAAHGTAGGEAADAAAPAPTAQSAGAPPQLADQHTGSADQDAAHTDRVGHIRSLARSGFRLVPVGDVGGALGLCKVCYTQPVALVSSTRSHARHVKRVSSSSGQLIRASSQDVYMTRRVILS